MLVFNAEFPATPGKSAPDVLNVARTWLSGGPSYPWHSPADIPPAGEDIVEINRDGHVVAIADASDGLRRIAGLRHHWNENGLRAWTTEIVGCEDQAGLWVSVKLYCDVLSTGLEPPVPKNPHIIKQLFEALGGGPDGPFVVQDRPHFLPASALDTAEAIVRGQCDSRLPIVYVSSGFSGYPFLDVDTAAKWLSGIAHVVVEPDRRFSLSLATRVNGQNVYGGAVGLYWPRGGGKPDRFMPWDFPTSKEMALDLQSELRDAWLYVQSGHSCAWSDLRELVARKRIEVLRESHSTAIDEYSRAFDEENRALKERAFQLESQLEHLRSSLQAMQSRAGDSRRRLLATGAEQDLYPGEISDAVVSTLNEAQANCTAGSRRQAILADLVAANRVSERRGQVEAAVRSTLANRDRLGATEFQALTAVGFAVDDTGRHPKAVFADDQRYGFTLFKTASDHRAGQNLVSEILKKLFKP